MLRQNISGKIHEYRKEIIHRNCNNFQTFTVGGLIITGLILAFGILLSSRLNFVREYLMFFLYMAFLFFVARECNRKKTRHIIAIYYVSVLPLFVVGILMGTFLDPERPAITIMLLLCVLTLFVIDKPWNMLCYLLMITMIFLVCDYFAKPETLFFTDLINVLIYGCIAVGVNYFLLQEKVDGVENYVLVREKSEKDPLTLLLNRSTGEERVKAYMAEHGSGMFFILDIDEFKSINDTYGHQTGDEVIRNTADIIRNTFSECAVIWRLGGDEFAVYDPEVDREEQCEEKLRSINESLAESHAVPGNGRILQISGGNALYQGKDMDFEELYRLSDMALYEAKREKKGR